MQPPMQGIGASRPFCRPSVTTATARSPAPPRAGPGGTSPGVPDGTFLINCNNPNLLPGEFGTPAVGITPATGCCQGDPNHPDVHVALRRRNVEGGPRYDDLGHTSYRAVFGVKG